MFFIFRFSGPLYAGEERRVVTSQTGAVLRLKEGGCDLFDVGNGFKLMQQSAAMFP